YSRLIIAGTSPPNVSRNQCDGHIKCSSTYQTTRMMRMCHPRSRARNAPSTTYGMSETPHAQRRIWWYWFEKVRPSVGPSAASAYTGRKIGRTLTRRPKWNITLKHMCESSGITSTSQKPTSSTADQLSEYVDWVTRRWLGTMRASSHSE